MILNSRKRRQIRQSQTFGQQLVIEAGKEMQAAGIEQEQVNTAMARYIAPGSYRLSWWANMRLVDGFKRAMKRAKP